MQTASSRTALLCACCGTPLSAPAPGTGLHQGTAVAPWEAASTHTIQHPARHWEQLGGSGTGMGTRFPPWVTQPQRCGFRPCPTARCGRKLPENGLPFLLLLAGLLKVPVSVETGDLMGDVRAFKAGLAKPPPGKRPPALSPAGWSGLGGDAQLARGPWLCTPSRTRGFSGTKQAVSAALSFGNNLATTCLFPPLRLPGKLEGPVSPPGCGSFTQPIAALGSRGSRRAAAGGKPGWRSLPPVPAVPLPSASTVQALLGLLGSPEETPSLLVSHQPQDMPHSHQPTWVLPGISATCHP